MRQLLPYAALCLLGCEAPTPSAEPIQCGAPTEFSGDATYYDANGTGACSFDRHSGSGELLVAAMNSRQWAGSAMCGMCARVSGPRGEVTVQIVDLCPECQHGDLDLSPQAFARIADPVQGRVRVTWHEVPCDVSGPVSWKVKDGSNPWWTAVQLRNHRNRIQRVERLLDDGSWRELPRQDYNYFLDDSGFGMGTATLRVTDVYGSVLQDTGITAVPESVHTGAAQFPACR